jgi:hypothetical protein
MKILSPSPRLALLGLTAIGLAACVSAPATPPPPPAASSEQPTVPVAPAPQPAQRMFASPADAQKALLAATKAKDQVALHEIFGPDLDELLSGDATQDAIEAEHFSAALAEMCNPVKVGDDEVVFYIGAKNWPFPIPLVRAQGQWFFDLAAGKEEILNRRIGEDELTAISVCSAYISAQHEYASVDRNNDGVLNYAQRISSTPGKEDGLYWDPVAGEDPSPFGPLVADARDEGYVQGNPVGRREPYHGYLFKILKEQGPDAPGGQYNYIINGNMIAGFALVAYPAHWGESGVMTFIVNQQGKIYQSNLGEKSADLASAMTVFNPDKSWAVVDQNGLVKK